jgi:hypothetical protein
MLMRIVVRLLFLWHGAQAAGRLVPMPASMEVPAFIIWIASPISSSAASS